MGLFLIANNISFSQNNTLNSVTKTSDSKVFECYPNPVKDHLYVIGTYKINQIEIIDVLGKRVALYKYDKSIIRMNISQLPKGIYLIKVTDEKGMQATKKLIAE